MRVNINVADSINEWFAIKSRETGISKSALMAMALNEYIDQKDSIKAMTRVDYFINQIDEIKATLSDKSKDK